MADKQLYSAGTFMQSALSTPKYRGTSTVQAKGFEQYMKNKGMYYVRDEKVFIAELDKYLSASNK